MNPKRDYSDIVALAKDGKKPHEITEITGLNYWTVYYNLRKNGYTTKKNNYTRLQQIEKLYNQGLKNIEICAKLDCEPHVVANWKRNHIRS